MRAGKGSEAVHVVGETKGRELTKKPINVPELGERCVGAGNVSLGEALPVAEARLRPHLPGLLRAALEYKLTPENDNPNDLDQILL